MNTVGPSTSRNPVREYEQLWKDGESIPDFSAFLNEHSHLSSQHRVRICEFDLSFRWKKNIPLPVERYLEFLRPGIPVISELLPLVVAEFRHLCKAGRNPSVLEFMSRFPDLSSELPILLNDAKSLDGDSLEPESLLMTPPEHVGHTAVGKPSPISSPDKNRPQAIEPTFIPDSPPKSEVNPEPTMIGRYRVLRVLGDGGFGRVYLAKDGELDRNVAIKVPHPSRVTKSADIDAYLAEARIVASLDHPAIVPVYDCGRTSDGRCFAVSKYIEGCDLATKLKRTPLTFSATAQLLQRIADGLHSAHLKGVIHRDIKPGNILLDTNDQPYIADFGIALKEEDYGRGHSIMGTVPYMSPEQLRGEGHLVDGRSDIFSLGVTMYEMLTGRRPFPSNRLSRDLNVDPRPLRQIDDSIPLELERICLKAIAPRVADRYSTALDFSADLVLFLKGPLDPTGMPQAVQPVLTPGQSGTPSHFTSGNAPQDALPAIVPKGLRSFDREDSSFFLQLLPGPRNREGIPESVLFWITRISEFDSDRTFRIGLIYGPSGCGKSSFVKAGVLPRLPANVTSIYIECTPYETEARLLRALRKHIPELSGDQSLHDSFSAIRRGQVLAKGRKLVIFLDQFEQYLHAHDSKNWEELLLALRQCDSEHLQCIIGVRDDFWMAVTHFMDELEVPFIRGQNVAAIDLFSVSHARKILTAIGQAYSALPRQHSEITPEQKSFVTRAVQELSNADKVIPVHLALFAEMVKDKRWIPATLIELGGISGIGVTFLEETFSGSTASPMHRLHQRAARSILKALLPTGNSEIKGAMRSQAELISVSGYEENSRDFDTLIRILDPELRLITPTDPEGVETGDFSTSPNSRVRERFYHLTHDYLVPSLRDWLARKQKETRRGRAELLLADRAAGYHARKSSRNLPSLLEWIDFLLFIPRRSRNATTEQRQLLQAARRYYSGGIAAILLVVLVAVWSIREAASRAKATSIVASLQTADTAFVLEIERDVRQYSRWTRPLLKELLDQSPPDSLAALHAAMVFPAADDRLEAILLKGLHHATPAGFPHVRTVLKRIAVPQDLAKIMWKEFKTPETSPAHRFRAALTLLAIDPPNPKAPSSEWIAAFPFLAAQLVKEVELNPESFAPWIREIRPIRELIYPHLYAIFAPGTESGSGEVERNHAASLLGDLYRDEPERIVALVLESDPLQYKNLQQHLLNPQLSDSIKNGLYTAFNRPIAPLQLETPPPRENSGFQAAVARNQGKVDEFLRRIRHQAHAAVALLEFDETKPVLTALAPAETPDLQSHTEDRLSRLGTKPETLFKLMQADADVKTQGALIRSLGGMEPAMLSEELRASLGSDLLNKFKTHPDSGIHSAAEWFLRLHGFADQAEQFLTNTTFREPSPERSWYVNPVGETMVVFQGPISTVTGSPEFEIGHEENERTLKVEIPRSFAMATTEVKYKDYLEFKPDFKHKDNEIFPFPESPVVNVSWDWAARYCNYLSRKAGIPDSQFCYEEIPGTTRAFPDYLLRSGYRLPTEAEWEHACRSGTNSPFPWGYNERLCDRYSITLHNSAVNGDSSNWLSTTPGPSPFGLFSMCGNVAEIIHENFRKDFTLIEDGKEKILDFRIDEEYILDLTTEKDDSSENGPAILVNTLGEDKFKRLTRGGGSTTAPAKCRSANRTESSASGLVSSRIGFRIARTVQMNE